MMNKYKIIACTGSSLVIKNVRVCLQFKYISIILSQNRIACSCLKCKNINKIL